MKLNKRCFGAIISLIAASAIAAVGADEAKKLRGSELTAWGAEKAGNKEGTIPAYTGERPPPPLGYNPKEPANLPDPYNEKPLFTITAQNMAQYANTLTEGQKATFKKYVSYRMDIYPTHRTAAYPQYVLDRTEKNATACNAVNNGWRLEGCYGGFPFPIPKTGNEIVWNHLMSHPGHSWGGPEKAYLIDASGKLILQSLYIVRQEAPYLDPAYSGVLPSNSYYWKIRLDSVAPARRVGEKILILDSLDPLNPGRRAWQYIPGQRRVKLAPDLAYDTPNPSAGGASTIDQARLFLGAQDRYDMKALGKREVFMMYNNFKLTDYKVCPDEVSHTKNFPNPDCIRWELHRAWVVEATLKPGFRHLLPKRMFYFDEDSWAAGSADSWDAAGAIYRVDNQVIYPWYFQPYGQMGDLQFGSDLQTGIQYSSTGVGFPGGGYAPTSPVAQTYFSPEALASEGIR